MVQQEQIVIKGLSKSFGAKSVLSGVDLIVEEGERLSLLGPGGCGKTTLINSSLVFLMPMKVKSFFVAST